MAKEYEKQLGHGGLEEVHTLKGEKSMTTKKVLELMEKEGLRPATVRELMEVGWGTENREELNKLLEELEKDSE